MPIDPLRAYRAASLRTFAGVLGVVCLPVAGVNAMQGQQLHDPLLTALAMVYAAAGVAMVAIAWSPEGRARPFRWVSLGLVVGAMFLETPAGSAHFLGLASVYLIIVGHVADSPARRRTWHAMGALLFPVALFSRQVYRPNPLLADPLELVPQALAGAVAVWGIGQMLEVLVRALEDQVASARAAERAKDRFLQNMSHELRTPLNAVVGYAELLAEEGLQEPDQATEDLARIQAAARGLLETIDDLLELARQDTETGRRYERVPLGPLLRGVAAQVAHRVPLRLPETEVVAWAEPAGLRRVMANLLANAGKFCDEGEIRVEVSRERGRVRIDVIDTGPGFAPELAERLFQPFVQGDDSSTRKHGGSGLGLALSRRLVEGMGGEIRAWSGGAGATFTVWLPEGPVTRPPSTPPA